MVNYAKDCEIIVGLVCPIGVNLEDVKTRLDALFNQFRYKTHFIHLSELANKHAAAQASPENEVDRLNRGMIVGAKLRASHRRADFYALLAIDAINKARPDRSDKVSLPLNRTVHIIRSLKHPDEVETLRQLYGCGFFLLGISASLTVRKRHLTDLKGIPKDQLDAFIQRDDKEKLNYGQRTRDVFQMADAFVTADDTEEMTQQLGRIVDLLFSKPVVTPTVEEYAMFMAYAASLRSADLSRQVGAVIMNAEADIVSTGANDVPKFGGGLYWPTADDQRDYVLGYDSNQKQKHHILDDVLERIKEAAALNDQQLAGIAMGLRKSRIMDITEFGRVVHAEMDALIQAARNAVSIKEASLYTTTYPCHNCAKHIVAAGIREVIYIEPYPKSYAVQLHSDSICADDEENQSKVKFRPFVGIGPRRFIDLFSMHLGSGRKLKRKNTDGVMHWERSTAELRVPMTPLSYLDAEVLLVGELSRLITLESLPSSNKEQDYVYQS